MRMPRKSTRTDIKSSVVKKYKYEYEFHVLFKDTENFLGEGVVLPTKLCNTEMSLGKREN